MNEEWHRLLLAALTQGAGFIVRACFAAQPRQIDCDHWETRQTHGGRWEGRLRWAPLPQYWISQIGDIGPAVEPVPPWVREEIRQIEDAILLGQ